MRRRDSVVKPVGELLEQARSVDYWRALGPQLTVISAAGAELLHSGISAETIGAAASDVSTRGFFQLEGALRPEVTSAMRRGVEQLSAAGWPVVFSFVYDEFWRVTRTPPVLALLRRILGDDCVQLEGIWTHYVQPTRGSHGWLPHVDSTGYRGGPEGLGVWFALSDATLDNGCIYVVPKDFAPEQIAHEFSTIKNFSAAETKQLLQSALALPARTGAMLGWEFSLLHWGSTCQGATEPRISTAMEFSSRAQAAMQPHNHQVEVDGPLPDLEVRLKLIAKSLLSYTRFEPLLLPFEPLANQLLGAPPHS